MPSIWQFVRASPDMIGRRVDLELHGLDISESRADGFRYAMPSVHHRAVSGEDDRIRQIRFVHELHVLQQLAPRARLVLAEPLFVEDVELLQRDLFPWKLRRKLDEPIHVPGQHAAIGRSEVILLAHSSYLKRALIKTRQRGMSARLITLEAGCRFAEAAFAFHPDERPSERRHR